MTPNRRRFLHFFDLCVPKTPSVSRDGSGNCNQARVLETIHFGGWFNLLSRLHFAFVEPEREYAPAPFGRHSACTSWRSRLMSFSLAAISSSGDLISPQIRGFDSDARTSPVPIPAAWLGWEDSNSEMSSQNIPLKGRTDFRGSYIRCS